MPQLRQGDRGRDRDRDRHRHRHREYLSGTAGSMRMRADFLILSFSLLLIVSGQLLPSSSLSHSEHERLTSPAWLTQETPVDLTGGTSVTCLLADSSRLMSFPPQILPVRWRRLQVPASSPSFSHPPVLPPSIRSHCLRAASLFPDYEKLHLKMLKLAEHETLRSQAS
eukprot:756508-Hanusia_phi.AAC.1